MAILVHGWQSCKQYNEIKWMSKGEKKPINWQKIPKNISDKEIVIHVT
jgi:hypothetical protein